MQQNVLPTFERRLCCGPWYRYPFWLQLYFVFDLTALPHTQAHTHTHVYALEHLCLFYFIIFSLLRSTSWLTTFKYSQSQSHAHAHTSKSTTTTSTKYLATSDPIPSGCYNDCCMLIICTIFVAYFCLCLHFIFIYSLRFSLFLSRCLSVSHLDVLFYLF